MELAGGQTLSMMIAEGALLEREVAALGTQIAEALEEAHERGVVHRDLKPGNIVVAPKGRVKVLDFGLAQLLHRPGPDQPTCSLTETYAVAGTLPYMAPEQLMGEALDARSDLYALGAVLYEMATGQRAFRDEVSSRLADAILHQSPVAPRALNSRISPELERIILKCLDKDPEKRYQSAKEIAVDLRRLGTASSATAVTVPTAEKPSHVMIYVGAAVVALILLVGAVDLLLRPRPEVARARQYIQLTNFADSATSLALSPDGKMLAFIRGEGTFFSDGQIYVKMLPDGEPVQLTNEPASKLGPVFSPDGTRIAYTHFEGWAWDTWIVPVWEAARSRSSRTPPR